MSAPKFLLDVSGLEAWYGASQVLFGVSLTIGPGEVVTLLGRNGMGKTTTVRSLVGLFVTRRGELRFRGERIDRLPSHGIARLGIGLVPEGRHIFPNLTVRENLLMAAANRLAARDPWDLERVVSLFPQLGRRLHAGGAQHAEGQPPAPPRPTSACELRRRGEPTNETSNLPGTRRLRPWVSRSVVAIVVKR